MQNAKRTPRQISFKLPDSFGNCSRYPFVSLIKYNLKQISLLPLVSRPRSIIRQLRELGIFSRQFQSFYRFRGEEKGEEYNFGCAVDLARCHVCAKRKEAGRQAREREIKKKEKKKKRKGRDEEGKNKTKAKKKHEC